MGLAIVLVLVVVLVLDFGSVACLLDKRRGLDSR
jgi:hypothetical protein